MTVLNPTIFLTFDVEEFDLPLEFNQFISPAEQMAIGREGLKIVADLLSENNISSTLFTTGSFASTYPDAIKQLSLQHEIASHALTHNMFQNSDLLASRQVLKAITGEEVKGFRMPRLQKIDINWIREAGYTYDSSIQPIYIPGRYNNFKLPRTFYLEQGILRLPCSVTPNFRIPLFWLSFKNLPFSLYLKLAKTTLQEDGYLILYFHPWEFLDLSNFKLPFYIRRNSGQNMRMRLAKLIHLLKPHASFSTLRSVFAQ
jgi:peptidoglycan/xylan/chitin deacetylase (PgdA/CDA1 family)